MRNPISGDRFAGKSQTGRERVGNGRLDAEHGIYAAGADDQHSLAAYKL